VSEGIVTADGGIPVVTGKPKAGDRVLYRFTHPRTREVEERPATVIRLLPDTPDHRCNLQILTDGGYDAEWCGIDAAARGIVHKRSIPQGDAPGTWSFIRE
jgi:hypothetical protein